MEGCPLDEERIIADACRGNAAAYEELVRRYEGLAFRMAYLVLHDAAEAEDAAQEAFFKAHRALWRFRPGSAFRPWLVRIVMNEARNASRAARRRGAMAERYGLEQPAGEAAVSPESAVLGGERQRLLLEAIGRLRKEDQAVLQLRYFLELSEAEMAQALGCPAGTVKSRLSRAAGRLRGVIEEQFSGLLSSTSLGRER